MRGSAASGSVPRCFCEQQRAEGPPLHPLGGAPAKPAVQPLKGAAAAPAPKATSLEESLMANLAGLSMNKQTSQPKLGGW